MKTLDRYVIRNFLFSAVLCFVVLMSVRIVVDLFVNIDEFTKKRGEQDRPAAVVVGEISTYYGFQSLAYFRELGGVIVVVAAAFTLARMNRTNELTAILASGVSLHRVLLPIILSAVGLNVLIIIDTELVIPRFKQQLVRDRDNVAGTEEFIVNLLPDAHDSVWFSRKFCPGRSAADHPDSPREPTMHRPIVFLRNPDNLAAIGHITAPTATYDAPARGWVFAPQKTRDVLPGRTELGWLGLEEAQRRKIDRILDIPADELKRSGVRTAAREKIAAVLTPRQAEDLDRHLSEHAVLRFEGAADTATSEFIPSLLKPEDIVRRAMELPENRSVKIDWAKGVTIRNIDTARFEKPREKSMTIRAARLVVAKVRDEPVGTLHDATFTYHVGPDGAREPACFHAAEATFVRGYRNQPRQIGWVLRDGLLRCRTDLDPENLSLRESSSWLQLMSWGELTRLFGLRRGPADPQGILFIKHTRFADFFDNIIMLLLTVPFILSRERNIKNSFGLAVLVGGTFYVSVYLCRYIGLDPVLGAWLPILVFGSAAPVMLHAVKT